MNVAHIKFYIPLECGGQKYQITVQIENPGSDFPTWMATGSDYKDPMQSPIGFGDSIEKAVLELLEQIGQPREFVEFNGQLYPPGIIGQRTTIFNP